MEKLLLTLFTFVFIVNNSNAQRTGSWGDQGDGTYINPILNADYPDSDVEKLGDTYYMITSKQHFSPGMPILESKDLVNWKNIGFVWDSLTWGEEYNWDAMDGYNFGVWAGDLAYHDGQWFCYMADPKNGLIMSTASDIRGPWSPPHKMLTPKEILDDPSVFWDEKKHEAYLVCNTKHLRYATDEKIKGNKNVLYKMSWDGKELLDEGTVIYTGLGAEASKIYKVNGIWYLFFAEWFSNPPDRKQIVLRSKTNSIYGPYDRKVVLERGNGYVNSVSQGALLQVPDGSWWFTHQLIQKRDLGNTSFEGRSQALQPVTWVDGWPIIGIDVDNDGIGEPVWQHKKPINGFPITAPPTDDEFSSDTLGPQWEWNHNARDSHWSLSERKGWLRLKAGMPINNKQGRFWSAYNTVSQRVMGTATGTATACFDISKMAPGQQAGMARFGGTYNLLGITMNESGEKNLFFERSDLEVSIGPVFNGDKLFIKTINNGVQAHYEYSTDGKEFKPFGDQFILSWGKVSGDRIGFFNWNETMEAGLLDVDWFTYDYDGPKEK